MTRKEAIFELIKYRRILEKDSAVDDVEPFDMAIRSLEAWDKVLKTFKFLYQFGKIEEYTIDIINQNLEEVEDERTN